MAALAGTTIDALYRAQVTGRPAALAVVAGDASLSYGQLGARTRALAARLIACGAGPEVRVALVTERSLALVVGALGIVEAGAALVPLDPRGGAARLRELAATAGAQLVVAPRTLASLAGALGLPVVAIDPDDGAEGGAREDPRLEVALAADPRRLLYVIQTSGSTAAPRAVEVEHGSVVDQIESLAADLGLGPADRHTHTASLGFTLAMRQLFLPLCLGGAVLVAGDDELAHPLQLLRAAARWGVTVLDLVPARWHALNLALRTVAPDPRARLIPDGLRLVLSAGERLPPEVVEAWRELAGTSARLVNLYGASEVGGSVAWHEVGPDDLRRRIVAIGKPRRGTTLALVDDQQRPVPDEGEVCIGGPAVARGYRAGTAPARARFLDTDGSAPRRFLTGDRGRRRDDGAIELVGRLDEEVKIRGVRVQPEAVASIVRAAPGVTDAAVVAHAEGPTLVAYLVGDRLPTDGELRQRVLAALPPAFVPAAFVRVDALPRQASGKLDRHALRTHAWRPATAAPAGTPLEAALVRHWTAILGVAPGVDEDVVSLGATSLLVFELMRRVQDDPGVALPLAVIFDRPTIRAQAAWLAAAPTAPDPRPPLVPVARGGRLALSFAQERLWLAAALAAHEAPHVHRALRLVGPLSAPRLEQAMRAVAARHETLRTTFGADAGVPYQTVHPALARTHDAVDLAALDEDARAREVTRLRATDRARRFDLTCEAPWRTCLIRLGRDEHLLLVTMHHLVTDGWSMRTWLEEVDACYAIPSRAAALPPLPVQPADVAAWQRASLAQGAHDEARAYWKRRLAGARPRRELPADGSRGDASGAWLQIDLDANQTDAVRRLAREEGCTVFVVLLAALARLLAELTEDDDVVVGALVGGRDRPELKPLIGLFLNAAPLRIDVAGATSTRDVIARARLAVRDGLAHAVVPFERIVAEANPPRQPGRNPLFDVAINYLPPGTPTTLGDLRVESLETGADVAAPFDAMWRVIERTPVLRIRVEYRRAQFGASRVQSWLDRFVTLLT